MHLSKKPKKGVRPSGDIWWMEKYGTSPTPENKKLVKDFLALRKLKFEPGVEINPDKKTRMMAAFLDMKLRLVNQHDPAGHTMKVNDRDVSDMVKDLSDIYGLSQQEILRLHSRVLKSYRNIVKERNRKNLD